MDEEESVVRASWLEEMLFKPRQGVSSAKELRQEGGGRKRGAMEQEGRVQVERGTLGKGPKARKHGECWGN